MITILRLLTISSVLLCTSNVNSQVVTANFSFSTMYSGQGFCQQPITATGQISYDCSQICGVGGEWISGNSDSFWMSNAVGNTVFDGNNVQFSLYLLDGQPWVLRVGGAIGGANSMAGVHDDFILRYNVHNPRLSQLSISSSCHPNIGPWVQLNSKQISFSNSCNSSMTNSLGAGCCRGNGVIRHRVRPRVFWRRNNSCTGCCEH